MVISAVRCSVISLSMACLAAVTPGMAGAATVGLQVLLDGNEAGSYDGAALGCADIAGTPTARCTGTDAVWIGGSQGLRLDSWNLFVDSDPVVSGTVNFTNLNPVTQQVTLLFTLPIAPAIPGATVIGGSFQGGATDNNGDGVTLSVPTASSFYTALTDGVEVASLYDAGSLPDSFSAGGFLSVNVPSADFGTPIPSLPGPAALSSIGIRLDFNLTGNDSASITSVYVVQPAVVPLPAAGWLLGAAVGVLGMVRRRRAAL